MVVPQQISQRLSSLDASFLYYEKKEAPLHVGSTSIFDGEIPFEEFKAMLASKLPLLPRYQQKVIPAPFNVGHPIWEFDPDFNIANHIFPLQLEAPGTMEELRLLSRQLQSKMLDRNKPLWEIYVVSGLEGNRSALITKVHHAMIDGISGVDLMNISYDLSPNPPASPKPEPFIPPPSRLRSITRNYVDSLIDNAEETMKSWNEFQMGLLNLLQTGLKPTARPNQQPAQDPLATLAKPVSVMPFNHPLSGEQEISWSTFPFKHARAIRAALGGTINDVLLTVVSSAVSRYLELHHQNTTGIALRIMVPVSMRQEDQHNTMGNQVSVMPSEIPMDIKDLLELHNYVVAKTSELKAARVAEEINLATTLLGVIPASWQALTGSLANVSVPVYNMVCTNVPGPQVPLYVLGKKLTESYAYVPISNAIGLTCAIFSYDQKLFFNLTADARAIPDLNQKFKPLLEQAFAELGKTAQVYSSLHT